MPVLTKKTALKAAKRAIFILLALSIVINMNATAQELEFVGSCPTSDGAYAVCVSGDFAYIVNRNQGLQIIGISDRANPVLVGSYDTPWDATDVSVEGELAYLVGYGGLEIIDIADPFNPAYVGSCPSSEHAFTVFLHEDYAYVGEMSCMEIFDVANPGTPIQVGYYYNVLGSLVTGIYIEGAYAFVARNSGSLFCMFDWCMFEILNISDPSAPELVSSLDIPGEGPFDVFVAGDNAYLANLAPNLAIVEITDLSEPAIVGSYGTEVATSVFVARHYAYLADWDLGVYVVDIADPANPILVTIYDTPHAAADIMVVGDYVYVADYDSFIILRFVNVPCQGTYIPGDCNSNGYPLQLADVTAMIGLYRGSIMPGYTCNCSPHGNFFAPQADPNGNCMAYELVDVVTEIAAYRGLGTVSGCPDCPPME